MYKIYKRLCIYFYNRLNREDQVKMAMNILDEIQKSKDYSIKNEFASKIIESVVKSSGNKIVDFIIKD